MVDILSALASFLFIYSFNFDDNFLVLNPKAPSLSHPRFKIVLIQTVIMFLYRLPFKV